MTVQERLPRTLLLSGLISLVLYAGYDHWGDLPVALGFARARPSAALNATILWSALWIAWLPAVLRVARTPPATAAEDRRALLWVLLLGILFRVVLIPGVPDLSSDFYRYLWDGRVFHAGVNPYAFPPVAAALEPLRYDDLHTHLNRPYALGYYPPLAHWVFRAVTALRPDVVGLKLAFITAEAAGIVALLVLLRGAGRPLSQSLVYLWNPLIVIELARGGHSDALMLPFLLLAIHFRRKDRMTLAGIALGLAALMRLYPIVLLAALTRRTRPGQRGLFGFEPSLPIACILTVVLGYLPFAGIPGGPFGHAPFYVGSDWEEFNAGIRIALRHLLAWVVSEKDPWFYAVLSGRILIACFLALCARVLMTREEEDATLGRSIAVLGGWLLLATPSLEPWYAWGLVALSAVTLSPAWIWFSGAVGLSYLKFVVIRSLVPTWVLLAEFVPTLALLAWEAGRAQRAAANTFAPAPEAAAHPLSRDVSRRVNLPLYIIGVFPLIAFVITIFFLLAGLAD